MGKNWRFKALEAWKDMFHIAILAKIKVDIRKIINEMEPEYVPPTMQEAVENETPDQKKTKKTITTRHSTRRRNITRRTGTTKNSEE